MNIPFSLKTSWNFYTRLVQHVHSSESIFIFWRILPTMFHHDHWTKHERSIASSLKLRGKFHSSLNLDLNSRYTLSFCEGLLTQRMCQSLSTGRILRNGLSLILTSSVWHLTDLVFLLFLLVNESMLLFFMFMDTLMWQLLIYLLHSLHLLLQ